jgi:hypothetical protein
MSASLPPAPYTLTVAYLGSGVYAHASTTVELTVLPS